MDRLTVDEFLAIFGCGAADRAQLGSADSEEYLTLITYLAGRPSRR